jgi:hypothetical protein
MSAIASIGNALRYDAVETLIMTDFAAALRLAAISAECREENDHSPESTRPTEYPATVRPGKR